MIKDLFIQMIGIREDLIPETEEIEALIPETEGRWEEEGEILDREEEAEVATNGVMTIE